MNSFLLQTDAVLRGKGLNDEQANNAPPSDASAHQPPADTNSSRRATLTLVFCVLLFGGIYGAAMGTFGGARPAQILFSACKVPILLLVTGGLSLPLFFVLYSLWGLRSDFNEVLRGLLSTQAALAVILASLAPFTLLWYASSSHYQNAIWVNSAMFAVASVAAQGLLRRHCRPLLQRDARHRKLLWAWLGLYAFIGIQMGWMLRPFIGNPHKPTTFFRADGLSNAYESILRRLLQSDDYKGYDSGSYGSESYNSKITTSKASRRQRLQSTARLG